MAILTVGEGAGLYTRFSDLFHGLWFGPDFYIENQGTPEAYEGVGFISRPYNGFQSQGFYTGSGADPMFSIETLDARAYVSFQQAFTFAAMDGGPYFVNDVAAFHAGGDASAAFLLSRDDIVNGSGIGNHLKGYAGSDQIFGFGGDDIIDGCMGADTLTGGAGADRFDFNAVAEIGMAINQRDVITDFQKGIDKIDLDGIDANVNVAGIQHFTWLSGNAHTGAGATLRFQQAGGNTLVYGDVNGDKAGDFTIQLNGLYNLTAADFTALSINRIEGTAGNDVLTGAPGGRIMLGGNGNDTIIGGAGADTIWGGAGNDSMSGGAGADVFKWASHTHSGVALGGRDIITDFQKGLDRLDLSGIDANVNVAGNQAFTWLGTAAHTGAGATLRYLHSGGNTLVYADVNGDKNTDFAIQINGLHTLTAADFVL